MSVFRKRKEVQPAVAMAPVVATHASAVDLKPLLERSLVLQSSAISLQQTLHRDKIERLEEVEFKVYSQFGDDGIITFLASHVPAELRRFIEFGVEDYSEANTRLLLERDNWSGLVIDGDAGNIAALNERSENWRYDLTAVAEFVTTENINRILDVNGFSGTVGLLSIDIDGNDYWLWEAIQVIKPLIVVCEYNAAFGKEALVTVPYDERFRRGEKHYSHLYAGCSLGALCRLAEQRGLRFIGCNRAGNNAYFVDPSLPIALPTLDVASGYVPSRFREARNEQGDLMLRRADECLELIEHLILWDVAHHDNLSVGEAVKK